MDREEVETRYLVSRYLTSGHYVTESFECSLSKDSCMGQWNTEASLQVTETIASYLGGSAEGKHL